jgi:hypothetical protein
MHYHRFNALTQASTMNPRAVPEAESDSSIDFTLTPFLVLLDERLATHPRKTVPYASADAEDDLALVKGVNVG